MFNHKSSFNVYLNKIKDKTTKEYYVKEFQEKNVNLVLESTEDYRNYLNFLIESKQLDVSKLILEEEILLIKYPKFFYENVWNRIKDATKDATKGALDKAKGVIDKVKDSEIAKGISTGMKTARSVASRAVQAVKNFDITELPASIKSGFMEKWKQIKQVASDMWKKAVALVAPLIEPIKAKIKQILEKPYVRILLACASLGFNIIMKLMSPVSVIMAIYNSKWKTEWPKEIGDKVKTIAEAAAEISAGMKKNKEEKQAKEEKQEITKESYNESLVYNDYYAEAREFLSSSIKVYNEGEVFVYNELTGADLPMQKHPSVKNAIKKGHNFVLIKNHKVDGKKFDIIIDLKNNRVGCLNPNNGMVDSKATSRFVSMFSEDFDLDGEKMYKWGKGEWSIIKKAINKGTFDDSSSVEMPSQPSIKNKKGNQIINTGGSKGGSGMRGSGRGGMGMGSGSDVTSQNTANAENKAEGGKVGDINIKIDNAGAPGSGAAGVRGGGLTKEEVQAMLDAQVTSPEPPKGRAGIAWLWSPEALRIYAMILLLLLICLLIYYLVNFFHGAAAAGADVGATVLADKAATVAEASKDVVGTAVKSAANSPTEIKQYFQIIIQAGGDVNLSDIANNKISQQFGDNVITSVKDGVAVISEPTVINQVLSPDNVADAAESLKDI